MAPLRTCVPTDELRGQRSYLLYAVATGHSRIPNLGTFMIGTLLPPAGAALYSDFLREGRQDLHIEFGLPLKIVLPHPNVR